MSFTYSTSLLGAAASAAAPAAAAAMVVGGGVKGRKPCENAKMRTMQRLFLDGVRSKCEYKRVRYS